MGEVLAYGIFASYFGVIFVALGFVLRSVGHGIPWERLVEGKPFLFLRLAIGALLATWYYMIQYMRWSFHKYAAVHAGATIGQWLNDTALFEEAWTTVCSTADRWWISSDICTWTVIFTFLVWSESGKRGIKYPWAYMLLGQLVAVSFSTALFLVALSLRPRIRRISTIRAATVLVVLLVAMFFVERVPKVVGTQKFLPELLVIHGVLLYPLFMPSQVSTQTDNRRVGLQGIEYLVYASLAASAAYIHKVNTDSLFASLHSSSLWHGIKKTIYSHPAQGSISFDVIFVLVTLFCWFFTTGSWMTLALKSIALAGAAFGTWASYTGVNWALVASVLPILGLGVIGLATFALNRVRSANEVKRKAFMEKIGVIEDNVIPGTDKVPPTYAPRRTLVGFWHPYCNSGGGGERVLWTAIAHLQKKKPDVISLVYTGDYPTASKEAILAKINERFSIKLKPETLHFIPLPSRHVVDDSYWTHFTLLGQSLGSIYLAWQGLCGTDGLWGDIFLDTMGYAFTYPAVRLIAGSDIVIGTYTHYPTVSTDMVERVRSQSFGFENVNGSKSWLRTQVKLLYYRIFTNLYSTCLLFSEYTMANSSWTHAHLNSLLNKGRTTFLASMLLLDELSVQKNGLEKAKCDVLYPPCDTRAFTSFGLSNRSKEIVSLAQFRPEKEHWKQIEALAVLFERKPELKSQGVKLVMMGGARHPLDEARVVELKDLARKKGVEDYVEFIVNAPYGTIVERLGKAGYGLNTMLDEHFGINIVEFMAAGLIPIVHASAGPLMDIVVPYNGQRTGFHAKTPEEFAQAIEEALSLSTKQDIATRKAARSLAVEKFSEESFNKGWQKGWDVLQAKTKRREQTNDAKK